MTWVEEENRRRRRVNRIKKVILACVLVAIIVPTCLSILLSMKVHMLEHEIEALQKASLKTADAKAEVILGSNVNTVVNMETTEAFEVEDVDAMALRAGVSSLDVDKKHVYLTFDDGPSENTEEILDILKEYGVKATFFVVGRTDEYSLRMYQRIVDEGHTLAMHSYTHVYGQIYSSLDSFKNDVLSLQTLLYETTGVKPTIYRFPGGSSNTVSAVNIQECIAFLEEEGITYFDWNVSSGDATGNGYPANVLCQNVLDGIAKQDNAVVLMHDGSSKKATVNSLPAILDSLLALEDVTILPLTEDSIPVQHTKRQEVSE